MKFTHFIDTKRPEEVIVYSHSKTQLINRIQALVEEEGFELTGYSEDEVIPFTLSEVYCFLIEANKLYALTKMGKLRLKCRLYHLEERLPEGFIKINQSCIANIKKIDRFDASISGSLIVIFKNGHRDYVSRRQIKIVKERIGIK